MRIAVGHPSCTGMDAMFYSDDMDECRVKNYI